MKPFRVTWTEDEPTCPGGGSMRWTVEVEEPNRAIGSTHAMISITEDSTNPRIGQDVIFVDVRDAERLIDALTSAVAFARDAEAKARTEEAEEDE